MDKEENKNLESENKEENKSGKKNNDQATEKTDLKPEDNIRELEDKLARAYAEIENQRRRFEKEKDDAFDYGGFSLARETLNLIDNLEIKCPISGTCNWTEVRQFNLMFKTELGSTSDSSSEIYLRPETAQGIFVNFLNIQKTGRMKLPFGIAQTGKAFRNEIVARQFIFRMREFEQMEMQFFIPPGTQKNGMINGKIIV